MKTLQTIITCLLLLLSLNTNAQDATNSATWEETLSFIYKQSDYVSAIRTYLYGNAVHNEATGFYSHGGYDVAFKIISKPGVNNDKFNAPDLYCYDQITVIIPLDKLSSAWELNSNALSIQTAGKNIRFTKEKICNNSFRNKTFYDNYENRVTLQINDSEMRPRLSKAFKHLFKLLDIDHKVEFIDKREFVDKNKF